MSIQNDVLELKSLDMELKRMRKKFKELKQQREDCERRIMEYLDVNEQPGLRMNGTVIMARDRNTRKNITKSDKMARGDLLLQQHGICNSQQVLEDLLEVMRGSPESKPSLRMY